MITTEVPGMPPIALAAYYERFAWYYPRCEMQTKSWFVRNARPDWVYFDCGASIGYYSILFARLSPQGEIHAFEPTSTADMLETNLAHNRVTNVEVHRVAVGTTDGDSEDSIYRIWGDTPERRTFPFRRIDTVVKELGLKRLDCVKIDVDSFDFDVLRGSEGILHKFNPWIVVELNHALNLRGQSNTQALQWLASKGYREALVLDTENFVLRNPVAEGAGPITLTFPEPGY